jgi:hypothetical protein
MDNLGKLACKIAVFEGIPAGADIQAGVEFFLDPNLPKKLAAAKAKANACIDAVLQSSGNPYGNDREAVAAAILSKIDKGADRYGNDREAVGTAILSIWKTGKSPLD